MLALTNDLMTARMREVEMIMNEAGVMETLRIEAQRWITGADMAIQAP